MAAVGGEVGGDAGVEVDGLAVHERDGRLALNGKDGRVTRGGVFGHLDAGREREQAGRKRSAAMNDGENGPVAVTRAQVGKGARRHCIEEFGVRNVGTSVRGA